jgi:hypothetical protein
MAEMDSNPPKPAPGNSFEDEDCYQDGPYLVFTEAYHLKRGYCCHSGCRHCPWKDKESPLPGS